MHGIYIAYDHDLILLYYCCFCCLVIVGPIQVYDLYTFWSEAYVDYRVEQEKDITLFRSIN